MRKVLSYDELSSYDSKGPSWAVSHPTTWSSLEQICYSEPKKPEALDRTDRHSGHCAFAMQQKELTKALVPGVLDGSSLNSDLFIRLHQLACQNNACETSITKS